MVKFAKIISSALMGFGLVLLMPVTSASAQSAVLSPGQNGAQSFNWSGYVASGSSYTGVGGTWTVPAVPTNPSLEADAAWVGIGGVNSRSLIQVGTQDIVNPNGSVTYQAFYELLPAASNLISMSVDPGDSITATIVETSVGEWTITIHNNTNGENFSMPVAYQSSLSSAEWIEEMPSSQNSFIPLDNFGSVSFSNGDAIVNGSEVSIAGAGAQGLTMVNNSGQALATVSGLGGDDASFSVTRTNAVPQSTSSFTIGGGAGSGRGRGRWSRVGVQGFTPGVHRTNSGTSTTVTGRGFTIRFGFGGNTVVSGNLGNLQSLLNQLNQRGVLFRW